MTRLVYIKTKNQIDKIRLSSRLAAQTLDMITPHVKPGITTLALDKMIHKFIVDHNAIPATLGYGPKRSPFPNSSCISINDEVVHGIPGSRKLQDGDLVKIDVTTILDGFYGDTARTYLVGDVCDEGVRLCEATKESLDLAIKEVKNGARLGDIGHAIQSHVEACGFSVVRYFVGHGVGIEFHEAPNVPHFGDKGSGKRIKTGMVFTIEPMINAGVHEVEILDDGWTAVTADGKLSAQFEHTVAVTDDGAEILTLSKYS
ncbi:MAG: type I methionyl aminopeptidase [Deltaproteobacteria bacterium]|jgi:methionyl aminopeptidase|nr:type I methionyl aminopeptidase [Deltaproteobacteria bacterium]